MEVGSISVEVAGCELKPPECQHRVGRLRSQTASQRFCLGVCPVQPSGSDSSTVVLASPVCLGLSAVVMDLKQ